MPADAVPGSTIPEDTEAEILLQDGTWAWAQVTGQRKDRHGRWCVGLRWYASPAVGGRKAVYDPQLIRRPDRPLLDGGLRSSAVVRLGCCLLRAVPAGIPAGPGGRAGGQGRPGWHPARAGHRLRHWTDHDPAGPPRPGCGGDRPHPRHAGWRPAGGPGGRAGNITWLEGDSSQVAVLAGPGADLAVFAASFHWTDRPAVLAALDGVLVPGGRVIVINDVLGDCEEPDWVHAIARIRTRYLGAQRRVGTGIYSHRDVLARSPFCAVDTLDLVMVTAVDRGGGDGPATVVFLLHPGAPGRQNPAFSGDVRAAVLGRYPAGVVTESFRVEVLIAAARP